MRGRLLLIFLIALPLFLLASMPVNQLLRVISLPPGLMLDGLEGTLFAGQVRVVDYRGLRFRRVAYRVQPLCLLRLAVCYRIEDGDEQLAAQVGYSVWGDIEIDDGRVQLPLSGLKPWMTRLLVKPVGDLLLTLRQLRLSNGLLKALDATVLWRKAGIEGEPEVLGDFQADLQRTEKGIRIQLADRPGAHLGVKGQIRLGSRDYQADVTLETRPALGSGVRNALDLLAKKSGLNRYVIKRSGRLPQPLPVLNAASAD